MRWLAIALVGMAACSSDLEEAPSVPLVVTSSATDPSEKEASPSSSTTTTTEKGTSSAPSCAREHGGRTCGPDGKDDCCAIAKQGNASIGKYMVTAGRMRAFVERFDGDIAGFVRSLPADEWKPAWNVEGAIPTDRASADAALGPRGKKACEQGGFTGHTYWTPKTDDDFSDFSADVLDEKALNCVPWELMQALCIWDGGHLATLAELRAAFTNDGTTRFPWGDAGPARLDRPDPEERLNIEGGFTTDGVIRAPAEASSQIAPPGRFPKGNNRAGVADAAGNLLEYVGDAQRQFVWKGDFEHHAADAALLNGGYFWLEKESFFGIGGSPWIWGNNQLAGNAGNAAEKHGYYAIGGRCAF